MSEKVVDKEIVVDKLEYKVGKDYSYNRLYLDVSISG